jgi:hypothetical protein
VIVRALNIAAKTEKIEVNRDHNTLFCTLGTILSPWKNTWTLCWKGSHVFQLGVLEPGARRTAVARERFSAIQKYKIIEKGGKRRHATGREHVD